MGSTFLLSKIEGLYMVCFCFEVKNWEPPHELNCDSVFGMLPCKLCMPHLKMLNF